MNESWQRILWVSWTAQILAIVGFSFVYPFLPLYVQYLGVHDLHAVLIWSGALYAGTTIALAITSPIWGVLSDRYGRKMMVVRSMISGAVIIFLMILVTNPWELLALRIAQGMLTGSMAASQALVSAAVPRERLGFSMGIMQMALFAGSSIGPLLGGQLDARVGYRPTFLAAAVMLAVAGMMVALLIDEGFTPRAGGNGSPRRHGGTETTRRSIEEDPSVAQADAAVGAPLVGAQGAQEEFWASARAILADRQLAALIVVLCAVQFGGQIVGPILPVFVQDLGGAAGGRLSSSDAAALAGNVFAVAGLGSAITAVLAGRLTDRRGHFKLTLLLATAATALLYVPHYWVGSIDQLYVLRGLVGLTLGAMLATASAMISLATPRERRGAAIGLSAGVNGAGQAIGQLGGSAVASALGIRAVFLITAGVVGLVSLLVAGGVQEPAHDPDEPPAHAPPGTVGTTQTRLRPPS